MDDLRVGLTLPTFSTESDRLVAVARSAEQRGLDGVFTYDHLFRLSAAGDLRPALALEPVLGLLAAKTHRIVFGSLVARATVRRAAVLRLVLDTVERMAPGRLVAGIGSGDRESDPEQAMFGLIPEDPALRLSALERTLDSVTGRGYPVWVGG
ncbi:MAG TPA: LLM class flavin-dependent oxidoreductase, partial [Acidimicrobiia bacterium]|nr:LLM class flavin-dependent oxidoreductase [Acidimicrobiia bacterium]